MGLSVSLVNREIIAPMNIFRMLKVVFVLGVIVVALLAGLLFLGPISSPQVLWNGLTGRGISTPVQAQLLSQLELPAGFSFSVYARDLPQVRFMRISEKGDLLVSRPRKGEVLLLERDRNGDGQADGSRVLLSGLTRPHGLELFEGWLYVAESNAVGRVRFDVATARLQGEYQKIITGLPDGGNHWSKTLRIGPDGMLYLSIGSSCNVCLEEDQRRATIMRFRTDGTEDEIYASGLRNSVGLDWAPWNQQLYATDNGRDLLGDDYPPCELNQVRQGGFYGWPFINGFGDADPDYGEQATSALHNAAISPVYGFRAHNAPLGFTFLHKAPVSPGYEKVALVALHGSWNRTEPDGYKVVSLHWQPDGSIQERDFLSGFEAGGDIIGRPVDVVEGSDGAIYISDDYAGAIYRVVYGSAAPENEITQMDGDVKSVLAAQHVTEDITQLLESSEIIRLKSLGKALYRQYQCAECHENGASPKNVGLKTLSDLNSRYTLEELALFFTTPTPPMPNFGLGEQQRKALAVYLLQSQ